MDVVVWLFWAFVSALSVVWSLFWFLISGWVSTLLQIAVVVVVIYALKYGWRRAPFEIWRRTSTFGRFFWGWIRARDPDVARGLEVREVEVLRIVRAHDLGDINISTLLSLLVLSGLVLLAYA